MRSKKDGVRVSWKRGTAKKHGRFSSKRAVKKIQITVYLVIVIPFAFVSEVGANTFRRVNATPFPR